MRTLDNKRMRLIQRIKKVFHHHDYRDLKPNSVASWSKRDAEMDEIQFTVTIQACATCFEVRFKPNHQNLHAVGLQDDVNI